MSKWGDAETPTKISDYEPQEYNPNQQVAFVVPGQPYIFDNLNMMTSYFEDMSMSTNTGPPSYDVIFIQSFLLPIPNECVGLIIGKQGDQIKNLRISSNASVIQVAKDCSPGCIYRNVFIEGSLESYTLAKKMIYEIIDENNRAKRIPTYNLTHKLSSEPYTELIIPDEYIPLILGADFSVLQNIINSTRAEILVPTKCAPGTNNRYLTITGQPEAIQQAKKQIFQVLEPAYKRDCTANGISIPEHEMIDPEFPYCSLFYYELKIQNITMTACEATCNSATAALKGLTLAGQESFGSF